MIQWWYCLLSVIPIAGIAAAIYVKGRLKKESTETLTIEARVTKLIMSLEGKR